MKVKQWTLPQRQDHIKKLRNSGVSIFKDQIDFQGTIQAFDVFWVDIGLPCYRLSNGRTRSAQKETIVEKKLKDDFFSADPDSDPALREQEAILRKKIGDTILLKILKEKKQNEPLILDNDGYIVNGNRRICAMRWLIEQDETKYAHFKNVQVIFLSPCADRDIKELEGKLQVAPDSKEEYSWVDKALLYRELREQTPSWTDDQIADLYEEKKKDIQDLLAMLDEAEQYMESRNRKGYYSQILKKESAFRQLQRAKRKLADEPKKQLMTCISYLMLDDQNIQRRLYESIPDAHKYLDVIADRIQNEFKKDISALKVEKDNLGILGEEVQNPYAGVIEILKVPSNNEAINVIKDTLEEMSTNEKERKDSTYFSKQIQKAYTALQNASNAFSENSEVVGVVETLKNIKDLALAIKNRIGNAND